ncbi:MAG: pitrilysin family protein [Gemmatimonadota bacterium]
MNPSTNAPDAPLRSRATPPPQGPIRPFNLPEVRADKLTSGLRLRTIQRSEVPLVSAALVLEAGESLLSRQAAGTAVLTGDSLTGGTAERSGAELSEAVERLGTGFQVSTGWDATSISFTCLAERLDETLSLLAEVVVGASFPPEEVGRVRRQRLAALQQRRMNPASLADDALAEAVFPPDHPYARSLSGEPGSVQGITRDAALAFFAERYRPGAGGFVLVGDIAADDVFALADRHLSAWKGAALPLPELPTATLPGTRPVIVVDRPDAVQSEIRIGLPGPSRGGPDDDALEVGNSILGGAFTSRLNMNLRERHGFTYGVRSRFAQRRHGGTFKIGTSVQTEVTARALAEAEGELRRFVSEGPTPSEVAQAREYLSGIFPLRMETTAQLTARLAEVLIYHLPDDHHHRYRERIRAVTPEGVRDAVGRHVDPGRARLVVVGDAKRIAGELEDLGLGPVEVTST